MRFAPCATAPRLHLLQHPRPFAPFSAAPLPLSHRLRLCTRVCVASIIAVGTVSLTPTTLPPLMSTPLLLTTSTCRGADARAPRCAPSHTHVPLPCIVPTQRLVRTPPFLHWRFALFDTAKTPMRRCNLTRKLPPVSIPTSVIPALPAAHYPRRAVTKRRARCANALAPDVSPAAH